MRTWFQIAAAALVVTACTSTPSDLREWRASDHDTEPATRNQAAPAPQASGGIGGAAKMLGVDQVVLVTWRQSCAKCHGTLGRGDGPEGAMYGAQNLADPAFQKAATDERLAASIKNGKGRMPAFQLPDSTITGLVHLIRMMNAEGPPGGERGSAAPPPSASAAAPTQAPPPRKRGAAAGSPR